MSGRSAAAFQENALAPASGTLAAGVSSAVLDRDASLLANVGYVAIAPFTTSCEIRKVTSITGTAQINWSGATAFSHAVGDRVLFFQGDSVPASWFGAKGDNSTDDEAALQWALREMVAQGLWLDGESKPYLLGSPLVCPQYSRIKSFGHSNGAFRVRSNFVGDPRNALLVQQNGNIVSFTASTVDSYFTTPTAHGMTSTGERVLLKGTMPGGVTAGKIYWAINSTADPLKFQVSETEGGAAITLGSNGSGTAYCKSPGLGRLYMSDVFIDGQNLPNVNGFIATLQQQTEIWKLRIDNCPGFGMNLGGQQAVLHDTMMIGNGNSLVFDGAAIMWFKGLNIERSYKRAIWVMPKAQRLFRRNSDTDASNNNAIWGLHLEQNSPPGWGVVTADAIANNFTVTNVTGFTVSGDTFTLTNHGLQNGNKVVFTGTPPAPLVAGTVYYAVGVSTAASPTTFKVSATYTGVPIVTTTAGTSPGFYQKFEDGDLVSIGPSSVTAPTPLTLGRIYYVVSASGQTFQVATTSGGAVIDLITTGIGTLKAFAPIPFIDCQAETQELLVDECTVSPLDGQVVFWSHQPNANQSGYLIRNVRLNASGSGGILAIQDDAKGHYQDCRTDLGRTIQEFHSPHPETDASYREGLPWQLTRPGGGKIGMGGQTDSHLSFLSIPGLTQTGDQAQWRDRTAAHNKHSAVNKDGRFLVRAVNVGLTEEPAAADLANGEAIFWLDSTSTPGTHALKVISKDNGGTVRRGTIALS